jgi:hypothetical protein
MLDGFKTGCLPLDVELLAHELGVNLSGQTVYVKYHGLIFGFIMKVDTETGEMRYVCTVSGSFHTFRNGGIHNADRLCLSDFKAVLNEFEGRFGIPSEITQIHKLEFGVNLRLPYSPKRVLNALKSYKGKPFEPLNNIGLQCVTNLFTLKIYDKSKQCKEFEKDNILRIEMRVKGDYLKRNCAFMQRKIDKKCFLSDLSNVGAWREFETILLDAIENSIMVESIPMEGFKKKDKELVSLFMGDGWQSLDRVSLCKKKKRFLEVAETVGALSLKSEILRMVSNECATLRNEVVNVLDKQIGTKTLKQETKSRYFNAERNRKTGNKIALKIKPDSVTRNHFQPAHPPDSSLHGSECTENIEHTRIRGKPGLKSVAPNTS